VIRTAVGVTAEVVSVVWRCGRVVLAVEVVGATAVSVQMVCTVCGAGVGGTVVVTVQLLGVALVRGEVSASFW
jgi:hypothetical protein